MSPDDQQWPTMEEVKAPKVKAFSKISQQSVFLMIDHERVNEEWRGEMKENLHLILKEKDKNIAPFKCRASSVLKKSLEDPAQNIYKMSKTHEFFITHNGEKQSQKFPENRYNDFLILFRPKVRVNSAVG